MENKHFKTRTRSKEVYSDAILDHGKIPPQALELEGVLLGAMMLDENDEMIRSIIDKIRPEMFYKEAHQVVCKAIKTLKDKDSPYDMLLVTEQLRFTGELETAGGPNAIWMHTSHVSSSANMDWHFRIIYQKFLQREMIRISSECIKENFEDTTDVFESLEKITKEFDELNPKLAESVSVTASDLADEMTKEFQDIKISSSGIIIPTMTYSLGWPRFDEIVTIGRDKIILLAGAAGAGKSKFIHQIICRLLEMYLDISVMWISLEDSRSDLLRSYIASKVFVTAKHIKMRQFDKKLIDKMLFYTAKFKGFDIEFIDEAIKSTDIIHQFTRFCGQRKDRFNILIVDNMLSLDDQGDFKFDPNGFANFVLHNMLKCRQRTHGCLFLLHHFNDAQMDKENIKTGYRPVVKDMKGSEGFRRVANQVLLINSFAIYKDLMSQYQGVDKEILDRLFIVDTGKNREDKMSDTTGLIHFVQDLGYSRFHEIPIPILQIPESPKSQPLIYPVQPPF